MLAFTFSLLLPLVVAFVGARKVTPSRAGTQWVDTWASMLQLTEPQNLPSTPYNSSTAVFVNSTIRQTVHTSIGGDQIRIRISNAFGTTDLPITAVTVALPAGGQAGVGAIQPSTLQTVTFSGGSSFVIPNGALALNPLYDSGDYLHPSVAGYQAIANAFPLDIFSRFSGGVSRMSYLFYVLYHSPYGYSSGLLVHFQGRRVAVRRSGSKPELPWD
ncbi:hypothetical protein BDN72DRAFT_858143 [Pluteus cervinus]|uniref:Uncharacterized protein n=1 Tax=Pluteus cervinus TaxID=181527 RepID=A0ACD3ASQ5_9AGAR|nr:hypothetical protein BDN72DRAFT_858143 [Pluteus cervinus]